MRLGWRRSPVVERQIQKPEHFTMQSAWYITVTIQTSLGCALGISDTFLVSNSLWMQSFSIPPPGITYSNQTHQHVRNEVLHTCGALAAPREKFASPVEFAKLEWSVFSVMQSK